jgi:FdhD protein
MSDALKGVDVLRVCAGRQTRETDRAAVEEPLEIRLHGRPFAVVMRTPGADRELAAGFLLAEGVITSADELGTISHCTDRSADHPENIINVTLTNGSEATLDRVVAARRQVTTNTSCGLCGRQTIESLAVNAGRIVADWTIPGADLARFADHLRSVQPVFEATGGLHAAGLFARKGELVETAEDVGRHNAVDKVIGRMLIREALPLSAYVLFVSGRSSFEIVQKAFLAGIPVVAAVSAPSSLAIDLAQDVNITLAGFVRGDSFNIYTHPHRIVGS